MNKSDHFLVKRNGLSALDYITRCAMKKARKTNWSARCWSYWAGAAFLVFSGFVFSREPLGAIPLFLVGLFYMMGHGIEAMRFEQIKNAKTIQEIESANHWTP